MLAEDQSLVLPGNRRKGAFGEARSRDGGAQLRQKEAVVSSPAPASPEKGTAQVTDPADHEAGLRKGVVGPAVELPHLLLLWTQRLMLCGWNPGKQRRHRLLQKGPAAQHEGWGAMQLSVVLRL